MKTRNFALCALGLAAAISIGSAGTASAQATTPKKTTTTTTTTKKTTTTTTPSKRVKKGTPAKSAVSIPVTKETATQAPMHVDTVRVMVHDTVQMMGRVDTVVRTVERYRVDTMMQMLPKQRLPGTYFGLGAGFAVPMNSFRDNNHDGPDLNAQLGWFPKDGALGIRGDVNYSLFPGRSGGTSYGKFQDTHIISGSADLVLRFPLDRTSALNPVMYFLGGGGIDKISNFNPYYNTDGSRVQVGSTPASPVAALNGPDAFNGTKYDYNVGGGFEFNVFGAHMYSEARYTTIMTTGGNTHYIPVLFGFHFY